MSIVIAKQRTAVTTNNNRPRNTLLHLKKYHNYSMKTSDFQEKYFSLNENDKYILRLANLLCFQVDNLDIALSIASDVNINKNAFYESFFKLIDKKLICFKMSNKAKHIELAPHGVRYLAHCAC